MSGSGPAGVGGALEMRRLAGGISNPSLSDSSSLMRSGWCLAKGSKPGPSVGG